MAIPFDSPPATWLSTEIDGGDVEELIRFLNQQGTFQFPRLANGLFAAAAGEGEEFALTGYHNVWTRDNVHIAHAHWAIGESEIAVQNVRALMKFYHTQRDKMRAIISGSAYAAEPMDRPHIRFNGNELKENAEKWSHAQNDALGYFLWIYGLLTSHELLEPDADDLETLELLVRYFHKIEYWRDEDSGHWEEARKIEASSIGVVVCGLRLLLSFNLLPQLRTLVYELIEQGEQQLTAILPAECIQSDPALRRPHDAALLFLIYPCELFTGRGGLSVELSDQIIEQTRSYLMGPYGIRRYQGDSYWCNDYKTRLSAASRTADVSEDMSARDAMLSPGFEAQWCIFDPILSAIYAQRYVATGAQEDRQLQLLHLQRSLGQLTTSQGRFPAFRCPESYYFEGGQWGPNDITPLLWTQANLRLALHWLQVTT